MGRANPSLQGISGGSLGRTTVEISNTGVCVLTNQGQRHEMLRAAPPRHRPSGQNQYLDRCIYASYDAACNDSLSVNPNPRAVRRPSRRARLQAVRFLSRTVALALRADPELFTSPTAVDAQNPRGGGFEHLRQGRHKPSGVRGISRFAPANQHGVELTQLGIYFRNSNAKLLA
jgi:hypothetical protein